jgi:hypothetical protein
MIYLYCLSTLVHDHLHDIPIYTCLFHAFMPVYLLRLVSTPCAMVMCYSDRLLCYCFIACFVLFACRLCLRANRGIVSHSIIESWDSSCRVYDAEHGSFPCV